MNDTKTPQKFMNPYLAGVLLGVTLLASFLILGAGLGASGGLARVGASLERSVAPEHVSSSEYFGPWGENPLRYYLVFMMTGALLGGIGSAFLANRITVQLERGRAVRPGLRIAFAIGGGLLVGFASRLGAGCTSGQALSGGALLLSGSLIFMFAIFAGGYAAALLVRRQWND